MPAPMPLPLLALAAALALTACAADEPSRPVAVPPASGAVSSAPASGAPAPAAPEVLVTGLEAPWGIDFLPDGDALVTERDTARVLRVPADGGDPVEVLTVEAAEPDGEGGLLGLAVGPSGSDVFLYVTTAQDNRVVRFDLDRPAQPEPVLTGIPRGSIHNGGRLAIGPDGNLYAGTGDVGERSLAQDAESLGGKVLRMTLDGRPVGGSLVFSRGHRNVQGLAFDAQGRLWATEFGQNDVDEVNVLVEGANAGWPEVEGRGGGGRFLEPVTTWDTSEASPSGAAIAGDSLYVAALRGQRLWRVPLADPDRPEPLLAGEYGRLRAVATAPDGSLWVLTSNRDGRGDPVDEDDRILRLAPR